MNEAILIIMALTFSFRPLVVHTEHITFSSMKACVTAKRAIDTAKEWADIKPKTFCVEK